jgi:Fur family transcriptional regulator, ferric uptake regulator
MSLDRICPDSMDSMSSELQAEKEKLETFLATRGLRMTSQRRTIFYAVFRIHGHVDAEELYAILKKEDISVSRASVYRSLDLFAEAGLVKPIRLGGKQRLYEHVHQGEHHDHLFCEKCGQIIEFFSPEIEELQTKVCNEKIFEPLRHTMVIQGICSKCKINK